MLLHGALHVVADFAVGVEPLAFLVFIQAFKESAMLDSGSGFVGRSRFNQLCRPQPAARPNHDIQQTS